MATPPSAVPPLEASSPGPCGSGQTFGTCCQPVLTGQRVPATAEVLMRARFSAHVRHDFRFLHDTYRPTAGKPFVEEEGTPPITWTKLVVHSHEFAPANPEKAFVDFSAYGTEEGVEKVLHEKAEFLQTNGVWLYNREARLGPAPYKAAAVKPGRNEPCPCGSGKKYKHCCMLKA